jgi:hypothetical protein
MSKIQNFLVVLAIIILIVIFTVPFLDLYQFIVGRPVYGGMGVLSGRSYFEGFFISYSFFVTLAITIFGGLKKYFALVILLAIIFLIQISVPESLIVSAGAAIAAWLIAQAILIIKKKISKK